MNTQDQNYHQKSRSISSAEPNYFVHFAMRYPVEQVGTTGGNPQRRSNTQQLKTSAKRILQEFGRMNSDWISATSIKCTIAEDIYSKNSSKISTNEISSHFFNYHWRNEMALELFRNSSRMLLPSAALTKLQPKKLTNTKESVSFESLIVISHKN